MVSSFRARVLHHYRTNSNNSDVKTISEIFAGKLIHQYSRNVAKRLVGAGTSTATGVVTGGLSAAGVAPSGELACSDSSSSTLALGGYSKKQK